MSFVERREKAQKWANEVLEWLENEGNATVPMGAERVAPSVHSVLSAMKNPDETARFVRYMPDGFAVQPMTETAFFFDAKAGDSIEKDAYLAYLAFAGAVRRVFIFIQANNGDVYKVPVKELRFRDSLTEVNKYSPERRLPVDAEGWIAPRLRPTYQYWAWKQSASKASGTPFRYFDFNAMQAYQIKPVKLGTPANGS